MSTIVRIETHAALEMVGKAALPKAGECVSNAWAYGEYPCDCRGSGELWID